MGLFSNIFLTYTIFYIDLALQANCGESHKLELIEKFDYIWEEKAKYFKFLMFIFFPFLVEIWIINDGSDLWKQNGGSAII